MQNKINKQRGFTIIETMISISLFLIVVTIGTGSLLSANAAHQKSRDMRSIIDNLSFVMEDMSRNLRTGMSYHCFSYAGTIPSSSAAPQNCPNGASGNSGISFISLQSSPTSQWVYYVRSTTGGRNGIYRSIAGVEVLITPDEADITQLAPFIVSGAPLTDTLQPYVTIRLVGNINYKGIITPFSLQTSVSQRQLDR